MSDIKTPTQDLLSQDPVIFPISQSRQYRKAFIPLEEDSYLSDADVLKRLDNSGWYKLYQSSEWDECSCEEIIKGFLSTEYWNIETPNPRGLFLSGGIGVGKTSTLCLIAKWLTKHFNSIPKFISTGMLFDMYFEKKYDKVNELMNATVLFLDDLGREYPADFPLMKFENFMEYRYGNLLPTFISSNISIEDLRKRPGFERIADRIVDVKWMAHIVYAGKSKRHSKWK
jgi:hypothetical protein